MSRHKQPMIAPMGLNTQPKTIRLAVRWACEQIGQQWRHQQMQRAEYERKQKIAEVLEGTT